MSSTPTLDPGPILVLGACVYPLNASRHHHHFSVVCLHFLMKYPFSFSAHVLSRGLWGYMVSGVAARSGSGQRKKPHTHTHKRERSSLALLASNHGKLSLPPWTSYLYSRYDRDSFKPNSMPAIRNMFLRRALFLFSGKQHATLCAPPSPLGGPVWWFRGVTSRMFRGHGVVVVAQRRRPHDTTQHEQELLK